MKVIKFRTWNSEEKGFRYLELSGSTCVSKELIVDGNRIENNIHNSEWMQFTGLKDKKGKEIYESDIVRIDSINQGIFEREVKLLPGAFFIGASALFEWDAEKTEVLGNIYENKELLDEKQNENN